MGTDGPPGPRSAPPPLPGRRSRPGQGGHTAPRGARNEERQRCANTIVNIMRGMFPHLRDVEDFKHKLWDHLAIMGTSTISLYLSVT